MTVQSVLFDNMYWTEETARAWLVAHGFRSSGAHRTARHIRFRQYDPSPFCRYRTRNVGNGILFIVGFCGR